MTITHSISKPISDVSSRSNSAQEIASISWSSSLPSLTSTSSSLTSTTSSSLASTSSSLTSTSISSRLSEISLGCAEDVPEKVGPLNKRRTRRHYPWMDVGFSLDDSSSSPFSHLHPPRRCKPISAVIYWHAKILQLTLWERVVFVLFFVYLWVLLLALVGAGETVPSSGYLALESQDVFSLTLHPVHPEPDSTTSASVPEQKAVPPLPLALDLGPLSSEAHNISASMYPPLVVHPTQAINGTSAGSP